MKWIVRENESLHVVGAVGFVPEGAVYEAPDDADYSDGDCIDLVEQAGKTVAVLNQSRKSAKLAEIQAKRDANEYLESRKAEYPSTNELIVALWEMHVENRPEAALALQAKREAVKEKYPKPGGGK